MNRKDSANSIRNLLAANAHDAWSRWTKHLLDQCSENEDGSLTIPATSAKRWLRQIATNYDDLTADEQASDLQEADLILNVVSASQNGASDATLL